MRLITRFSFIIAISALLGAFNAHAAVPEKALVATELTMDHLRNPIGVDNPAPRFSWKIVSDRPSTLQTAYQIRVIQSGEEIWSTGKVASGESLYHTYQGPELESRTRYQWQVRVWDNHDRRSDWSAAAFWETGMLLPGAWSAKWISYPWQENIEQSEPSPLFRREFTADCSIAKARLTITALGLYEAHINGKRVGDAYFTPGWTSYDSRLQYQVYDVSDAVKSGANAIGIVLGDGWYRGFLNWEMQRNLYGDQLAARAQLRITCEDGSERIVDTDESWKVDTGAILASDIYNGETQDRRLEQAGWDKAGFNDQHWHSAVLFAGEVPPLVATAAPPVRAMHIIRPVALLQGPDGKTIVDMGQNMVGWVRLRASGKGGEEIVLRHAEVLDQDGSLYLEALRNAKQRVSYILDDAEDQVLEPHFTFQGFRYVSVEGFPGELTLEDIEGVVLYSDMEKTGHFTTSSDLLNQLQSNIVWGQRGNFLEVPTDCPQRDERLGWTGDAQVFARTALFNTDSEAFFNKWLADIRADQFDNGGVPYVVPDVLSLLRVESIGSFFLSMEVSASGWGDVITELPSALYERSGDRKALTDNYEAMKRWVAYEKSTAASWWRTWIDYENWFSSERREDDKYIWNGSHTFGDWLAPVPLSNTFVNTVYFARSSQLMEKAAHVLGKTDDEQKYRALFENIQKAFQRRYLQEDGRLSEHLQGAYVLALQFGLLDDAQAERAAKHLNALVIDSGYHLATGFLSTPYLLPVLQQYGYLDTAYKVLLQEDHPSWLYPVTMGATTIWERWGSIQPDGSFGDGGMNSFNHYAYGAVGDWMYRTVGGIAPAAPGYKKILIAPRPGGDLQHASVKLDSPYGPIESAWRIEGEVLQVQIQVPANTTAEFVFPARSNELLYKGKPVTVRDGVLDITSRDGYPVITLGSGRFEFSGHYGGSAD